MDWKKFIPKHSDCDWGYTFLERIKVNSETKIKSPHEATWTHPCPRHFASLRLSQKKAVVIQDERNIPSPNNRYLLDLESIFSSIKLRVIRHFKKIAMHLWFMLKWGKV